MRSMKGGGKVSASSIISNENTKEELFVEEHKREALRAEMYFCWRSWKWRNARSSSLHWRKIALYEAGEAYDSRAESAFKGVGAGGAEGVRKWVIYFASCVNFNIALYRVFSVDAEGERLSLCENTMLRVTTQENPLKLNFHYWLGKKRRAICDAVFASCSRIFGGESPSSEGET